MVSPVSPMVANPSSHSIAPKVYAMFHNPPQIYARNVDGTLAVIKYEYRNEFLNCLSGDRKHQESYQPPPQLLLNHYYGFMMGIHRNLDLNSSQL